LGKVIKKTKDVADNLEEASENITAISNLF
jgi:hypothetical protein